eukprot:sb/3478510/
MSRCFTICHVMSQFSSSDWVDVSTILDQEQDCKSTGTDVDIIQVMSTAEPGDDAYFKVTIKSTAEVDFLVDFEKRTFLLDKGHFSWIRGPFSWIRDISLR